MSDQEGVVINAGKWSLSGDDAAMFQLTGTDDNMRDLEFKDEADFENPGDSNGDNIYEVTVVASDGTNQAERSVRVKITDSDEQGEIMLSDVNPETGSAVTATLTDSDGDVIDVGWTWYGLDSTQADNLQMARDEADPPMAISDFFAANPETARDDGDSSAYTPASGDIGMQLVAVARYVDRTEDTDNAADSNNTPGNPTGPDFTRFDNIAVSATTAPVIANPANAAPEFAEAPMAVRYVEEDAEAGETIGALVTIADGDLPNDSHTYTLSGSDAASFDINAIAVTDTSTYGSQLVTKADLDYESKSSYTVVVMVEDGSGESNDTARITVNIQVKDLDEKPVITGNGNITHMENDTSSVATLSATDPEGVAPIHWDIFFDDDNDQDLPGGNVGPTADDIAGTDTTHGAAFEVEGGVLSFIGTPNYEATGDIAGTDPAIPLSDRPDVQGGGASLGRWTHRVGPVLQAFGRGPGRGRRRGSKLDRQPRRPTGAYGARGTGTAGVPGGSRADGHCYRSR